MHLSFQRERCVLLRCNINLWIWRVEVGEEDVLFVSERVFRLASRFLVSDAWDGVVTEGQWFILFNGYFVSKERKVAYDSLDPCWPVSSGGTLVLFCTSKDFLSVGSHVFGVSLRNTESRGPRSRGVCYRNLYTPRPNKDVREGPGRTPVYLLTLPRNNVCDVVTTFWE